MSKVSGGLLVARALAREGVKSIFSLSGNQILPIYDGCLTEGIRIVDTRHEAAAAHMADATARLTRQPAVCLVTAGPGHANALSGLATAFAAGSPVVLISGASEQEHVGMGAMQEIDQVAMARPVTKWSGTTTDIRRLPEYVTIAFRNAMAGRPGPVHLSLPADLLEQIIDDDDLPPVRPTCATRPAQPYGDPEGIAQAITLLAFAERPVVIAGDGAWWGHAERALAEFVEITGLPLFTIGMARGMVSDEEPHCLGYADPLLNRAATMIQHADLLLVLGKTLDFRLGFGGPTAVATEARVIQIDVEAAEIGRNRQATLGMVGDVGAVVAQLAEAALRQSWPQRDWLYQLREARLSQEEEWSTIMGVSEVPIHPLRLVAALRTFAGPDTILAFDGGDFIQFARAGLAAKRPGRWLRLGPMSTLGCAIPFALAAKLAFPESDVLALSGDGGFGYYAMEFDTAMRHNLPFVTAIANDGAWGTEREIQTAVYGSERVVGTVLRRVRYDRIVTALGGYGEHVESPNDLGPALERARRSRLPACVDVATAYARSSLTASFLGRRGVSDLIPRGGNPSSLQ